MPRADEMEWLLRFEARELIKNSATPVGGWREALTVWAKVKAERGSEELLAGRLAGLTAYRIWIEYSPEILGLGNAARAVDCDSGLIYEIKSIIDTDGRRRELEITAIEGATLA